ncbi:MAG: hypothetical protein HN712_04395 [Gemmatimonadetes bacterium]|nr:hypothetical protein [Gemmatimonadota bacterium]MBT7859524.1 hypothetical protein [Gemmatimonadota bacterium]
MSICNLDHIVAAQADAIEYVVGGVTDLPEQIRGGGTRVASASGNPCGDSKSWQSPSAP